MARNVEIKARLTDPQRTAALAAALADTGPEEIIQDDTFFACSTGRLKLREFDPQRGELIFYRRSDLSGPKESYYLISTTDSPASLRRLLTEACGQVGRVRKQRTLYLSGRTRIHLDRVEGLGDFVELEVVLEADEPSAAGEAVARQLMQRLEISPVQLVEGAYLDLLSSKDDSKEIRTGKT